MMFYDEHEGGTDIVDAEDGAVICTVRKPWRLASEEDGFWEIWDADRCTVGVVCGDDAAALVAAAPALLEAARAAVSQMAAHLDYEDDEDMVAALALLQAAIRMAEGGRDE